MARKKKVFDFSNIIQEEPYDEVPAVPNQEANQEETGIVPGVPSTLQLPVNSTQEISLSVPVVQVPSTAAYQVCF